MGRIVFVGDRNQAIYGFRGAGIDSVENQIKMMQKRKGGYRIFPLTTCRRCPKSHIRLAQAIVPDIRWCVQERDGIEAPEGEIYQVSDNAAYEMMQPGDMGIARTNRFLIPACYTLIRQKKKAIIRGRDIGKGLLGLINKLKPTSLDDLIIKLNRYLQREVRKILIAEGLMDKSDTFDSSTDYCAIADEAVDQKLLKRNAQKYQNITDKVGCIEALMDGVEDLTELRNNIEKIFAEFDDSGKPIDAIVLGTVHRTKGLEAHNVTVLDPENFPHKMATKPWEVQQERNLAYVAATRAKFQFNDKGELIQPGRLIFVGQCPPIYRAQWLMGQNKYPAPGAIIPAEPERIIAPQEYHQPATEISPEDGVQDAIADLKCRYEAGEENEEEPPF